jgi:molecular chaperone HtpG
MTTETQQNEYTFQAEIKQLLHLLSHSLYQSREIALRELISNASDALDKMRHIALVEEAYRDDAPLEIRLEIDKEQRQLRICDNGVGMTRDELVANLGTIARSGSLEFLQKLTEGGKKADVSLIGQFGVGFYSAFMLADTVQVRTRSYQGDAAWEWQSEGTGTFTIVPAEKAGRGTEIILNLKADADEFLETYRLESIVRRYSSFVQYPIKLDDKVINDQKAIWVEPASQLSEDDYARFYQHISHHTTEKPLWHLHVSVDSPIQFHALLYCPPTNIERLGFGRLEHGINLCAKRILVQSDCREVLPEYFRFLVGLVDSEDLPLNVSRESLQDNTVFRKIRAALIGQIINKLLEMADDQPEVYEKFYEQFSPMLKEGTATDFQHRDKLARLLRFPSTRTEPGKLTSLDAYVDRMVEKQDQIYYLGGPDLEAIASNPNLEIFRRGGLEVLFLSDPVDEFVMANLQRFDGTDLVSIDSADLKLPKGVEVADETKPEETSAADSAGLSRVLALFREALGDRVADVRESKRLTDSPVCLVNPEPGMSTQMQKLLKMADRDFQLSKRVLEVNPRAALIQQLAKLSHNADHEAFIKQCAEQLFDNAQMLDGLFPDPRTVVQRMHRFMEEAASKRSPIIT